LKRAASAAEVSVFRMAAPPSEIVILSAAKDLRFAGSGMK